MRWIVAADSGPCDAQKGQTEYLGPIACPQCANRKLR
jgi:hypothetical protein